MSACYSRIIGRQEVSILHGHWRSCGLHVISTLIFIIWSVVFWGQIYISWFLMRLYGLLIKCTGNQSNCGIPHAYILSSSFVSFTQCYPTCRRMPLPALSLWPGRQPYRPRLVGDRRGGGPSSVASNSRNPPTGCRRDSPISSSLFSHGPPLCAVS